MKSLLVALAAILLFGCSQKVQLTVTAGGTHVSISPNTVQTVDLNGTVSFTAMVDVGYLLATAVGGTCSQGTWEANVYTTGAVTDSCTVLFEATLGITISDGPIFNFGTQFVGSSTDKIFTVTNAGEVAITSMAACNPALSAPFSFKDGSYPGTGGTCSATLAASGTCTIVVTFSPAAANTFSDTVRLSYNGGQSTQTATLSITGSAQSLAHLSISDGSIYDYGIVTAGLSANHVFTVTNSGVVPATSMAVGSPALSAPFDFKGHVPYPGMNGTCGATLAASQTCTIVVSFFPFEANISSDTIRLSYNDSQTTQTATRQVTGTGGAR